MYFRENHMLEAHMANVHNHEKSHKCDICGAKFYLTKWRPQKHMTTHEGNKTRFCHYYNNNKSCPFFEIGCKFLHKKSEECSFKDNCGLDKCQYRH